jgi:hypothetical protein
LALELVSFEEQAGGNDIVGDFAAFIKGRYNDG